MSLHCRSLYCPTLVVLVYRGSHIKTTCKMFPTSETPPTHHSELGNFSRSIFLMNILLLFWMFQGVFLVKRLVIPSQRVDTPPCWNCSLVLLTFLFKASLIQNIYMSATNIKGPISKHMSCEVVRRRINVTIDNFSIF